MSVRDRLKIFAAKPLTSLAFEMFASNLDQTFSVMDHHDLCEQPQA